MANELVLAAVEQLSSSGNDDAVVLDAVKELAMRVSLAGNNSAKISILQVVENLGPLLTDPQIEKRQCGTSILAELVFRIQPISLSSQEADVIVTFFCDRLKDHHSIQPIVIYGLLAVVSYQKLSSASVNIICQTLFKEVHVQSLNHADRKNTYNMLSNLLNNYYKDILYCGQDFVLGFIQSIDGEKDPRNLLVCFECVSMVIDRLPFDNFKEDLFEVVACYFPIDFRPPPDQEFTLTQEQLVSGLRRCLSRTSKFAEYILPMLLDKLSSEINEVKVDCLLTLVECLKVFSAKDIESYIKDVWGSIRRDLFLGGLSELQEPCQDVVTGFVNCFDESSWDDNASEFLNGVVNDCKTGLLDANQGLFVPSLRILIAAGKNSVHVSHLIMQECFPVLVGHVLKPDNFLSVKAAGLCALNELLDIAIAQESSKLQSLCLNMLKEIQDHVSTFLTDEAYKEIIPSCANFLTSLTQMKRGQGNANLSLLFNSLFNIVCESTENSTINECLNCLCKLFSLSTDEIKNQTFNKILTIFEGALSTEESYETNMAYINLTKLCKYLCNKKIISSVDILKVFSTCIRKTDIKGYSCLEHFISCFKEILVHSFTSMDFNLQELSLLIINIVKDTTNTNEECIKTACDCLQELLMKCNNEQQELCLPDIIRGFNGLSLFNFDNDNSVLTSFVSKSVIVCLHPNGSRHKEYANECRVPPSDVFGNEHVIVNTSKVIASLINKMDNDDKISTICQQSIELVDNAILEDSALHLNNYCIYLLWLARGLLQRWHSDASVVMDKVMALLANEKTKNAVSANFGILLKDYDDVLCDTCHVNSRLFYKQRFLQEILPALVKTFTSTENGPEAYLRAISKVLQTLPTSVLKGEVENLLPLLLRSLYCNDDAIIQCTLETLLSVDDSNSSVLNQHITALVDQYINLGTLNPKMKIRMLALKCLLKVTHLPSHLVIPLQRKVTNSLKKAVADKKRLVRKEAVICQNAWYLL